MCFSCHVGFLMASKRFVMYVPWSPCRLSHGNQTNLLCPIAHGRGKKLATPGDPYVFWLPCRLSHGIQAVCRVRTLVAV